MSTTTVVLLLLVVAGFFFSIYTNGWEREVKKGGGRIEPASIETKKISVLEHLGLGAIMAGSLVFTAFWFVIGVGIFVIPLLALFGVL